MKNNSSYVLGKTVKARLEKRGFIVVCEGCSKPIIPRQVVCVRHVNGKTKPYHRSCFRKLWR